MHGSKHKHSKINSVRTQIHRHTAAADEAINIDLSDWWQHLSYHREFSSRIRYALRMHTDPKTDINITFTFFSQPFFVSREDYNKKQKDKKLRSLLKHRKMCHIIELSENKSGVFFLFAFFSSHERKGVRPRCKWGLIQSAEVSLCNFTVTRYKSRRNARVILVLLFLNCKVFYCIHRV